jgi:regulator-associated protein of mTOR
MWYKIFSSTGTYACDIDDFQSYTQYIPLSVYDLQTWMGSPSIYVYDCSNAGIIIELFRQFSLQRESELEVRK